MLNVLFAVDDFVKSMFWCSRCFGAVNVLVQSIFCSSRCYWSMFWRVWYFDVVDILVWLMFWCGQCFDIVDVLVQSMFWCGQYFSVVDILVLYVLVWSMFWGGSIILCSRCFGTVDGLDRSKFCVDDVGWRPETLSLYFTKSIKSVYFWLLIIDYLCPFPICFLCCEWSRTFSFSGCWGKLHVRYRISYQDFYLAGHIFDIYLAFKLILSCCFIKKQQKIMFDYIYIYIYIFIYIYI